ncbi:hypothetical protein [Bradyrhizobium guangzhouense]|uniref:hypothetical protein n=1 Tax=Bradyrhizobium guangzhouense TaxID=1325095 RepID=UPI001009FDA0|nr:hypothetical protein [Bradyrhizobium guangzhouense]RXH16930.1 hypothetical protein EAS54_16285 [Bradyrhizobium guangzhouense]
MRQLGLALALVTTIYVNPAAAVTAEVAKACSARLAKAFPPREPGNPAAGSTAGNAQEQRKYFANCVANGGRADTKADSKPSN